MIRLTHGMKLNLVKERKSINRWWKNGKNSLHKMENKMKTIACIMYLIVNDQN